MTTPVEFKYLTQDTNIIGDNKNLLLNQFKGKEDIEALVALFAKQYQYIEDAIWGLIDKIPYQNAEGVLLDTIGELFGEARNGSNDATYRARLPYRAQANCGSGTFSDMYLLLQLIGGNHFSIKEYDGCFAYVYIYVDFLPTADKIQMIKKMVGIGIAVELVYHSNEAALFKLDDSEFSEYNYYVGDQLGEQITI
jgi:hypothetical protein